MRIMNQKQGSDLQVAMPSIWDLLVSISAPSLALDVHGKRSCSASFASSRSGEQLGRSLRGGIGATWEESEGWYWSSLGGV